MIITRTPFRISFFGGGTDYPNWYLDFNQSLVEQKSAYQGMAYRRAANEIENIDVAWEKVWFVGLNALTKSEERIINHLKEKDIAGCFCCRISCSPNRNTFGNFKWLHWWDFG